MKKKIEARMRQILLDPTVEVTPESNLSLPIVKYYDYFSVSVLANNRQLCLMVDQKDYRDIRLIASDMRAVNHHYLEPIYVAQPLTATRACRMRQSDFPFLDLVTYDHIKACGLRPEDNLNLEHDPLTPLARQMVLAKIRHELDGFRLTNVSGKERFPCANKTWSKAIERLEALGLLSRVRDSPHTNSKHYEWKLKGQRLWDAACHYMSLPPPDTVSDDINELLPKGIDPLDAFLIFKNSTNAEIQHRIRQGVRSYVW